jgi:DNA replication protein DnaC
MFDIAKESPTIQKQILNSGVPLKSIGKEFSDLDQTTEVLAVKKWVDSVLAGEVIKKAGSPKCGLGVLLVGEPGHGKTTLASTALQSLIRGISGETLGTPGKLPKRVGVFMDYPKLLRLQKSQFDEMDENVQLKLDSIYGDADKSNNVPVFVLDDLGKEYRTGSKWSENQFDALLRSRYNAGLPTIVTTNVPLKDWYIYGESMESFAREAFMNLAIIAPKGDRRK